MALFGFLGGKKTSVGLDIGSGIIKLVVIDHSGSEPELAKVATTEVAADAIVEGEVMDPGIVAEAIRGLFSAAGVKHRSVVTAVGGRDVIVKKIQMDRMKEADAREVIRWQAEQHVPFDMANVELAVGHVERHVLLSLPADHLARVRLLHPIHLDLLDDHVPPPDGGDDRPVLHPGRGKQPPDRLSDDAGVHDLALDDGVGRHLGGRHLDQLRLAATMVDDHQLDDAGADIEADRGFFAAQEPKRGHSCLGVRDKTGRGQTTVSPAPYPVKPRTYLRPNQQLLCWPTVRPLSRAAATPVTAASTRYPSSLTP